MEPQQTILLTGVGAPGVQGTLYALRALEMPIIGTDMDEQAVGRYLCDAFYTLPPAKERENYLSALQSLCRAHHVAVIVPQNTAELLILAEHRHTFEAFGTHILVSGQQSIETANNKFFLLQRARSLGLPTADFALCSDFIHLEREVLNRRHQGQWTVVKPPCGNGSRGVRIIIEDDSINRKQAFYQQKPSALYCTLDELHAILGDSFPELLVMDYLEGEEYTVDVLRTDQIFLALPRKREVMRSGITFRASLENNETIIKASQQLAEDLDLQFCFGFQFKKDRAGVPKLLECNPRVQGTMVMSVFAGANIIEAGVRTLLGQVLPAINIDWNTRLVRYWGAVGINETGIIHI